MYIPRARFKGVSRKSTNHGDFSDSARVIKDKVAETISGLVRRCRGTVLIGAIAMATLTACHAKEPDTKSTAKDVNAPASPSVSPDTFNIMASCDTHFAGATTPSKFTLDDAVTIIQVDLPGTALVYRLNLPVDVSVNGSHVREIGVLALPNADLSQYMKTSQSESVADALKSLVLNFGQDCELFVPTAAVMLKADYLSQ